MLLKPALSLTPQRPVTPEMPEKPERPPHASITMLFYWKLADTVVRLKRTLATVTYQGSILTVQQLVATVKINV